MITRLKVLGWSLIVIGILLMVFSGTVVFPGLVRVIGIESIVGKQNVYHHPNGGYYFTNPGAVGRWIASIVAGGLLVAVIGLGCIFRARRSANKSLQATAASLGSRAV